MSNKVIDVACVTWPNHPERILYFRTCMQRLSDKLSASRHAIQFSCSAESQRDPACRWCGDELEALCKEYDIALTWREGPADLGANMNAAMRLCKSELIFLQQDDWMLEFTLDLSPGADFISEHREVDIVRYSWPDNDAMRPTFMDDPSGWRRVDIHGYWPLGDDPHLRRRDFMDQWGWYTEGRAHEDKSRAIVRRMRGFGGADIRATNACYYGHGGRVTAVINDTRPRAFPR